MEDLALGLEPAGWLSKPGTSSSTEDQPDCPVHETNHKSDTLLAHQPLRANILQDLHDLTQFENLVPRFSATVPPCWNEIQQEQQQRRHPQHLQQQGDSTQHTRSWRLQQDSSSFDEHLFELVIPKSCCVGHIDIKFSLHPLCTSAPHIQVTLLRQSMSKLSRVLGADTGGGSGSHSHPGSPQTKDVDCKIDFKLPTVTAGVTENGPRNPSITDEDKVDQSSEAGASSSTQPVTRTEPLSGNPVITKEFLEQHGAEVLCGPVDMSNCVDLSGHGGIITLTGPELLKIKSRSFLVHFKAIPGSGPEKHKKGSKSEANKSSHRHEEKDRASTSASKLSKSKLSSKKHKDISGLPYLSTQERLTALTSKQKLDSIRGCDWLQELSMTVRRCHPVAIPRERLQRVTMLEDQGLHENLLKLVCGREEDDETPMSGRPPHLFEHSVSSKSLGLEQRRILALDILTWICSILTHGTTKSREPSSIILTTESYLKPLVRSCFLEASRTIAHQCTKFLTALIEYTRSMDVFSHVAANFSYNLLTAFLDCLSLIPTVRSAGALHWYFVVLNRIKAMDIGLTGAKCVEMLSLVTKCYNERSNPLHALLKSRFGLYGHPLEPDLFDLEAPALGKSSSQVNMTFANILKTNNNNNNGGGGGTAASTPGGSCDEVDIQDYLLLSSTEKGGSGPTKQPDQVSHHVFGLLEVEPLHFTCHAASDGTRLERMDAGPVGPVSGTTSGVAGLSGTINFGGESIAPGGPNAMSSLSAVTEHQLSVLHQKHIQLLKLQQQKQKLEQKLAETSKGSMGSSSVYNNPELFPPTPKNTPFFMTPPVTPPNESYHNIYVGGPPDPGKPPTGKEKSGDSKPGQLKSSFFWSQTQHLFQPMPPQALVIERLHSGARRFVVLDFGKPVLLTDVIVPGCSDLQSLSIDIWSQGEDVDGQRLVVAGDIGLRSLVLSDLCPPPLCRYLKITTIGRNSGNASRSKIPLGFFYGHSFVFPWQSNVVSHPLAPSTVPSPANEEPGPSNFGHSDEQNQVMSQLGLCMSLHEDIQCRYSLACNRLTSLLSLVQVPHNSVDHTLYYLKQGKKTEDDKRVLQAYHDCTSLQLQLNLAQWAIDRLQGMLGVRPLSPSSSSNSASLLKQTSTDKLRILSEFLLNTLLSMSCVSPTVPQVPTSLYVAFTPQLCESLFRHLCLTGTKKIQIHTGVLLVRLCGNQPWWGEFLGNTIQEYFTSEQPLVFPRDRVFLVLCALSQKALSGPNASHVLESLVSLLGRLLSPLLAHSTRHHMRTIPGVVDQSLVSWMLLFLSRSLDNTSASAADDNADKAGAAASKDKDKDTSSSRWDFLQGESSLQKKGGATRSRKTYHARQRRGYWHPKYQLQMQQLNKEMFSHQANKALSTVYASPKPEAYKLEALNKTHSLIKKQYKQYSSKHFKDMLNIRRTTGEYLRKLAKEDASQGGTDGDLCEADTDIQLSLSRDRCLPVVRGLVALLLSTDFTCHTDMFIVACKVLARVSNITRPAMMLSEVFSQSELDELMLLTCNAEYNHGNVSWGGSWAGHTIGCLLQDILDGERQFGLATDGVTDDEVSASVVSETDDSIQNSTTLPTIDEDNTSVSTEPEISQSIENNNNAAAVDQSKSYQDEIQDNSDLQMILMTMEEMGGGKLGQVLNQSKTPSFMDILSSSVGDLLPPGQTLMPPGQQFSQGPLKFNTKKLGQQYGIKVNPVSPHGVSTAMDARLEHGVQLPIELRLKILLSMETENIQNALTAPIPPLPGMATQPVSLAQAQPSTDDEQLSEASLLSSLNQQQVIPSVEMLSTCFNALFCHRVNMETLLLLWVTLNEETTLEENGIAVFDSSRIPSIPLNEAAVGSLLSYLCRAPHVPIRTWVLAFQCLTLLTNLKNSGRRDTDEGTSRGSGDRWLAHGMLADPNLMTVLLKFLTGSAVHGLAISSQQSTQVGPTAVKAFHEVLGRLQLRCADESENMLRELLLRLIYQLSTERGAFGLGIGPLDAQCKLLDHMLEQSYQNIDINNAISVIESVSFLVHQHILSQTQTDCRSSTESGVSARSCFGGLFANVLQAGKSRSMTGDANRDMLMCNLLSLVNLLVQAPVPQRAPRRTTIASVSGVADQPESREEGATAMAVDSPMTDFSKISQSLGGASVLTSTPNFPMSDDEKGAETDEQKTEHAVPAPKNPPALARERRSCAHFWDVNNPDSERRDPLLTDFVLGHEHIMFHFLQALGACNSNAIATILGSSGNINDSFLGLDPLSVGDGIFQILCTMNRKATDLALILRPLFQYLSTRIPSGSSVNVCQLSEPLLWFILSVLDCEKAFRTFIDMGGVEVVCNNLVRSTRDVISTSPGLVSTIMQYLGGAKGKGSGPRKISDVDNGESLQNFAPLGTITSSSPSAGPADVLIQGLAPHRRARSAAWSFNFYPHEAWVDLTINLPCAILMREVHVQPHLASLATCPSAVTLEISRDNTSHIPITAPLVTSGLNSIKITLNRPEVVSVVTLRLHKPRDSSTIGLSQIKVLGSTAFGDSVAYKATSANGAGEDYVARTSMGWLRLLHHCLTHCNAVHDLVAMAAAPVQPLLMTCTSLLLSSGANLYINNIEAVLLRLGLHSAQLGLSLIDHLLRNLQANASDHGMGGFGRTTAVASESTVDLLFQLGISQDDSTSIRVKSMVDWLGDSARVALQRAHASSPEGYQGLPRHGVSTELPNPAPAHVHCVAAIMWESQERRVQYNLANIVSREVLSSMYEWSMVLVPDSALKKAVDAVICSICYIHPEYFSTLLEWMAIILSVDLNRAFLTDDHKDNQQHQPQEAMTDDLKATSEAHRIMNPSASSARGFQPIMLQEFGHMMLDESHLSTLSIACQSPLALRQLLDAGFLAVLCQGLYEFCLREMSRWGEPVILSELFTETGRGSSGPTSPRIAPHLRGAGAGRRRDSAESSQDKSMMITADLVAPVLRFLTEISKEVDVKDWLGSVEGCVFWPVLLRLLCSAPVPVAQTESSHVSRCRALTVQQRSAIETSTIDFFSCVLSCHHRNQLQFANILCDVIRGQGSTVDEYGYRSSPLCGFMRCLFLQVLLEDEKVWVCLKASSQLYKGHSNALTALVQHPRFGAGHRYRVVQMSLQSSCNDVMAKVSDTPSLATQTAQLLEEKGDKTLADDWLIDSNELGIEVMVEQISAAAGLQAKEKRDAKLSNKCTSPSRPPRPPSRRGHCPSEALGAMNIPVLMLYHRLLPGQPLPGDLSLSQLMVMLQERGLSEGQAYVDFNMKFKSKPLSSAGASCKPDAQPRGDADPSDPTEMDTDNEPIPESVLLETPSLPTALQVFAGVGGLALLAEHLPLLYPEVTRQGAPLDGDKAGTAGNVAQDWVTVENTEDIYEEIYEPIPPNPSTVSNKQAMAVLPSIPPHSLVAFGLFLRLPGYAEVLLKEKRKAQCLLRLVLGVTDDGEGGHILTSPIAPSLPTLPFNVLKLLFDSTPLSTDDGVLLRRMTLEIGAVHLVLACLSVLSHHAPRQTIPGIHQEIILAATQAASAIGTTQAPPSPPKPTTEDRSQLYWAKGTGFGTGSTASYWDAEQAMIRQRCEEEHVTCLLQVLSSFIHPGGDMTEKFEKMESSDADPDPIPLPGSLPDLFSQSCLAPAICSYLRNDSVLDMARHVPLYRSLLELLRGLAMCPLLVPLLLPLEKEEDSAASISSLLEKMKICVDTYASRLKTNKKAKPQRDDEESEGLALLIPDIQSTAALVDSAVRRVRERSAEMDTTEDKVDSGLQGASKIDHSLEDRYMSVMRELQFDTYEIVVEEDAKLEFTVPHHYESNAKAAGEVNNASRARRLAQEAVTLSTSLPLSAGSSVFVRCDEERLDIMKVLITGPSDTPYDNGCFEFDVYFPQDYPNTPPQINLETTGNHTVRFNPNLYNDGKVCLSILNTWHGRPEEKWNSQTSSFLQVLVSIQSLILVSEPYFNEPGYERSRGTASGSSCSKEYDANIRQATVKWAMLEMVRNPPACFKEVIEEHFWMKQHEILRQVEGWIADLEANCTDKRVGRTITHSCVALKRHFAQLKEEFAKMKPPSSLADQAEGSVPCLPESTEPSHSESSVNKPSMVKSQTFTSGEPSALSNSEPTTQAIGNTASGQALSPLDLVEVDDMQGDGDLLSYSSGSDSEDIDMANVESQQQTDDLLLGL